jgi:sec-independent protein translocase protein TatA
MGSIGAPEIILVIVVLVLLFGAKKLPDLARGSGRALRIFKAETKSLADDDDETGDEPVKPQQQPQQQQSLPPSTSQSPNGTESSDASQATRDQQQS